MGSVRSFQALSFPCPKKFEKHWTVVLYNHDPETDRRLGSVYAITEQEDSRYQTAILSRHVPKSGVLPAVVPNVFFLAK